VEALVLGIVVGGVRSVGSGSSSGSSDDRAVPSVVALIGLRWRW
jgi:hypothetical protein